MTSYSNFISDHNAITARMGVNRNVLNNIIREKITFDKEKHLKTKASFDETVREKTVKRFTRRFKNPDMKSCWLNSCLQLILVAIDYDEATCRSVYSSKLGLELLKMKSDGGIGIDPTIIKNIMVLTEDQRIASRLS